MCSKMLSSPMLIDDSLTSSLDVNSTELNHSLESFSNNGEVDFFEYDNGFSSDMLFESIDYNNYNNNVFLEEDDHNQTNDQLVEITNDTDDNNNPIDNTSVPIDKINCVVINTNHYFNTTNCFINNNQVVTVNERALQHRVFTFLSGKRANILFVNGYLYHHKSTSATNHSYWVCVNASKANLRCPARATTFADHHTKEITAIRLTNEHSHEVFESDFVNRVHPCINKLNIKLTEFNQMTVNIALRLTSIAAADMRFLLPNKLTPRVAENEINVVAENRVRR